MKKQKLAALYCILCDYLILKDKTKGIFFCNCREVALYDEEKKRIPFPRHWKNVQVSISSVNNFRRKRIKAGRWTG